MPESANHSATDILRQDRRNQRLMPRKPLSVDDNMIIYDYVVLGSWCSMANVTEESNPGLPCSEPSMFATQGYCGLQEASYHNNDSMTQRE